MIKRTILIFAALLAVLITLLAGCVPEGGGGAPPDIGQTPGTVTLVKSVWSGGDLDFTKLDGTKILGLDGTNGDVEITTATITTIASGATITSPTITSPTITTPTITGTGTAILTTANITTISPNSGSLTITSPSITGPAITGTSTIGNGMTLTTPAMSSPTITGTSVVSNRASGNVTFTEATTSAIVTHGMSSAPTRIWLQPRISIGTATSNTTANPIWIYSISSTQFIIYSGAATNQTAQIDWMAFIADE